MTWLITIFIIIAIVFFSYDYVAPYIVSYIKKKREGPPSCLKCKYFKPFYVSPNREDLGSCNRTGEYVNIERKYGSCGKRGKYFERK